MQKITEIFVARHGQNEDNANGILNGHRDLPLTEIGRNQARQLGEGILAAELEFDVVYSSPLSRAFETAEIAASIADLPEPVVMDSLIERDFGIMTGLPIESIKDLGSDNVIETETVTYFLDPEGAETFPDLINRGESILQDIRRKHIGEKVLLVCHGDLGKMIYAAATNKPWKDVLREFHFGNGDLIDIKGESVHKIQLDQYNS